MAVYEGRRLYYLRFLPNTPSLGHYILAPPQLHLGSQARRTSLYVHEPEVHILHTHTSRGINILFAPRPPVSGRVVGA